MAAETAKKSSSAGKEKCHGRRYRTGGTSARDCLCDSCVPWQWSLERIYENALAHRLRKLGLRVDQQHSVQVFDEDGALLGACTVDLLVDGKLVLELKAVSRLSAEHIAQIIGYLKACRLEHGRLINFGASRFEIRKFVFTHQRHSV